jgi:cell division protein FtsB
VRRAVYLIFAAVAVAAILLLFVLPGRTFLSQQRTLNATQVQVNDLATENAHLKAEAQQLQSNSDIESIARQEYGLVMPGQKAYAVIPAGTTTTTTTPPARRPATGSSGPARSGSHRAGTTTPATTLP